MKFFLRHFRTLGLLAGSAGLLFAAGCLESDSVESAAREVGINVAGFYANGDSPMVAQNSGAPIRNLNLRQFGDRLEGTDNNGVNFTGSIGRNDGSSASFTLEGRTTAGAPGIMVGTINVSGTSATMRGTWAEDAVTSTLNATATVPESSGGGGGGGTGLTITPSSPSVSPGGTQGFSVSGGTSPYTWSVSNGSLGSVSPTSGSSTTYSATSSNGTQSVTATDTTGATRSVSFTQ